ncbi:hypothetical protein FRB96_008262 [Tulasnella sp. 330]|nr:hypothetical protein FRB96_008262 [Tulasnella sp. 330]KAG8886130.1 hypothetical protein FRB97_007168 [Tulasnella sp. 331]KAG8890466.1 hypothetical protein FRB98_008501 [Tulasnella sp. 332]
MNPRTKLAFFGDDDDDLNLQLPARKKSKPIDDQKAKTYTQGNLRKSKREKEKEAEEAKRAEEEIEAAKAYAEFIDAFDAPDRSASGGGGSKGKSMGFVKASGGSGPAQSYDPLAKKRDALPTGPRGRQRSPPPSLAPGPASAPKAKGKRAMDAFLEELKRDQADREARFQKHTQGSGSSITALAAFEGQHGSRDRGDPLTTNIFVTNLPMGVTEQSLGMFFAKHGPVGSVKIMWPRGDAVGGPGGDITARRGKAAGMSGFVSYMNRRSAEECVREMDGFNWGGCALRVGWSKAVPIAARPAYGAFKPLFKSDAKQTSYPKYHFGQSWMRIIPVGAQGRLARGRGRDPDRRTGIVDLSSGHAILPLRHLAIADVATLARVRAHTHALDPPQGRDLETDQGSIFLESDPLGRLHTLARVPVLHPAPGMIVVTRRPAGALTRVLTTAARVQD